jgi:hypothetical protein
MPVALLPPITSGGTWGTPTRPPLTEGPRYVRTRNATRWHRVRAGYQHDRDEHITWILWCTKGGAGANVIAADEIPAGDDVCGPCVGKALGAKQDDTPPGLPSLRFDPRWLTPPSLCPGSGRESMFVEISARVGQCKACGEVLPTRYSGGRGYSTWSTYGVVKHAPGAGLVEPCPWHAWRHLRSRGDTAGCECGWQSPSRAAAGWIEDAT